MSTISQNLINKINNIHNQAVISVNEEQSLTLSITYAGWPHVTQILDLCNDLATNNALLHLSLNDIPMKYFEDLIKFLEHLLHKNQMLQYLTINIGQICTTFNQIDCLEEQVQAASHRLEEAMKSNSRLRLRSFIFSVPIEYRESTYIKYDLTLSPIKINQEITNLLSRETPKEETSFDLSNSNSYFFAHHHRSSNQVMPLENKTQLVESQCHCAIS